MELISNAPTGPIEHTWENHKFALKLINPANKRKYNIIVVGSGLAGAAAAASFGELGYNVQCFCFQDSARRAHSIAAQGGINAAKTYHNDGDSVYRLFYDTVKGGDYLVDQDAAAVLAQGAIEAVYDLEHWGLPFNRTPEGYRDQRRFGGWAAVWPSPGVQQHGPDHGLGLAT